MKFFVFFLLLAVANAIVLLPEDAPLRDQQGQCPSGYPFDGLFSNCSLGDNWRIGQIASADTDSTWDVSMLDFNSQDFDSHHPAIDDAFENSFSSCSLSMPGFSTIYQPLFNLKYAHYRVVACARAFGPTDCSVVIKDVFNRVVDEVRIHPDPRLSCPSSTVSDCVSTCTDGIRSLSIRFIGLKSSQVTIRALGDSSNSVDLGTLIHGQVVTINATDFQSNNTNCSSCADAPDPSTCNCTAEFLPEVLEIVWGSHQQWSEIIRLTCDSMSVFPGQEFGHNKEFLVVRMDADDARICEVADFDGSPECPCEDESNSKAYCFESSGFVALPDQVYYLGLESHSCRCAFDNVCLIEEDHFGLKWVESGRKDNTTSV